VLREQAIAEDMDSAVGQDNSSWTQFFRSVVLTCWPNYSAIFLSLEMVIRVCVIPMMVMIRHPPGAASSSIYHR
jgi:hypothetical protein